MNAKKLYAYVDKEDYNEQVLRHAKLIRRIAYHLLGRLPASVQIEDLIQAGMIGLLEAIKNYNPTQGASFETYAGIRIRGAMLDELRRGNWTPRSVSKQVRELGQAMQRVEHRLGRDARDSDVAQEMGIPLDEYHKILQDAVACKVLSFDDIQGEDGSDDAIERLAGVSHMDHAIHHEALMKALVNAMKTLPERERLVMSLYYDDELNLREISVILKVSESRVSQIHGQALIRLRNRLGDWIKDGK